MPTALTPKEFLEECYAFKREHAPRGRFMPKLIAGDCARPELLRWMKEGYYYSEPAEPNIAAWLSHAPVVPDKRIYRAIARNLAGEMGYIREAEHYALYLWGHGWNWHPEYTMEDASQGDALDPHEVSAVQPQLGFIDLVAYDGCNMGSAEVDALWHGHATAIVHSQEDVVWDGIEPDGARIAAVVDALRAHALVFERAYR